MKQSLWAIFTLLHWCRIKSWMICTAMPNPQKIYLHFIFSSRFSMRVIFGANVLLVYLMHFRDWTEHAQTPPLPTNLVLWLSTLSHFLVQATLFWPAQWNSFKVSTLIHYYISFSFIHGCQNYPPTTCIHFKHKFDNHQLGRMCRPCCR